MNKNYKFVGNTSKREEELSAEFKELDYKLVLPAIDIYSKKLSRKYKGLYFKIGYSLDKYNHIKEEGLR